jgi:hypothetical protein
MPTDGTNDQANHDQNNDKQNQKVTFTTEQQARIDELIREAMGRAGRETRTELESTRTQLQTLQAELNTAKDALKTAKTSTQKADAAGDIAALHSQIAEMKSAGLSTQQEVERLRKVAADKDKEIETAKQSALNVRKNVAMREAADRCKFVDTSDVVEMTDKFVRWEPTRNAFVVINESGQERFNAAYEPMTLEEFYVEYAAKKPHMVRGDARGGTGSAESQKSSLSGDGIPTLEQLFGPKANAAKANKLAMENIKEYRRLKELARSAGLIS